MEDKNVISKGKFRYKVIKKDNEFANIELQSKTQRKYQTAKKNNRFSNAELKSKTQGKYQSVKKVNNIDNNENQFSKKRKTTLKKFNVSENDKENFLDKNISKNKTTKISNRDYADNKWSAVSKGSVISKANKPQNTSIHINNIAVSKRGQKDSIFTKKANRNEILESSKKHVTKNKNLNLTTAVSKSIDNTVRNIDQENKDENIGIKSVTGITKNFRSSWKIGKMSFERVRKFLIKKQIKNKSKSLVTKQLSKASAKVISSSVKQVATKTALSLASTIAPLLIFLLVIFMIFFLMVAIITPTSYFELSGYPGTDQEVSESNQALTNKSQEMKVSVIEVEDNPIYSHINEFRYIPDKQTIIDSFDYDPFILLSYLSAKYQDYNMNDVKPEIDSILSEMFTLSFTEKIEIKYDDDDEPYNHYVLEVTLVKKDLQEIVMSRMTEKEKELYKLYLEETGDIKSGVDNPFDIDWYNNITCKMGWRLIDGKEDNHTGMDIGLPLGTPIKAGVTGIVTKVTTVWPYGNRVEISTPNNKVTVLYAHMDTIAVSVGDPVMAGITQVGTLGSTGWSSGPHLHIEVFVDGQRIDPILVLSRA